MYVIGPMASLPALTMWLHIGTGVIAVLAGIGALITAKGSRRHRLAGKTFVGGMGFVVGTTVLLLGFDPTQFRMILTLVAIFSGYLAFSGYRVLSRKRSSDEAQPIDLTAAGVVIAACLLLGGWGLWQLGSGRSFGTVMVVFGGIGLAFGSADVHRFLSARRAGSWQVTHLQRMIAAFIATVSAVSAVNLTATLGIAAWLWPTAAFAPLIAFWSNKYDRT